MVTACAWKDQNEEGDHDGCVWREDQSKRMMVVCVRQDDEVVQYWLDKAKFEKRRLARPDYYKVSLRYPPNPIRHASGSPVNRLRMTYESGPTRIFTYLGA